MAAKSGLDKNGLLIEEEGWNPFAKVSEACALRNQLSNPGWGRSIATALRSEPGIFLGSPFSDDAFPERCLLSMWNFPRPLPDDEAFRCHPPAALIEFDTARAANDSSERV
jgi:hypothetical protein